MAEKKRVFLGWDAPLVNKVRDHLLESVVTSEGQAPDLTGNLVIVPTRHAGRRLRESLARWCESHNTALLSAQIVPPSYLFLNNIDNANLAGSVLSLSTWVQVLRNSDLGRLKSLFPSLDDERSFQWALNTGEIIQSLRDELSDGAYSITGVLEQFESELEELDRWRNLAELEKLYLEELKKLGKQDMCAAKISAAGSVQLDPEIRKIIVAGVPDPSLLALEALKSIASAGLDVEILVHADSGMDNAFDEWGRPDPGYWRDADVDIPDWDRDVLLEAKPAEQAQRVIKEIARQQDEFESGEIAIGVPDRSVIPFLEKFMSAEGLDPFDPSDKLAGDHPIGRLSACMLDLIQEASYRSVAGLLRHPNFISYLKDGHELESLKVLGQLDAFQNYYLPVNLRSMLAKFKDNPKGTISYRDDFTELGKALDIVQSMLDMFKTGSFEDAWRRFFQELYKHRLLKPGVIRDAEFENAATAVDVVLREFRDLDGAGYDYGILEHASFFVTSLAGRMYHRERRDEIIDLEGWLELPWNDCPFLLVAGMNEEFVPGGSLSDVFLPDSLRRILDLRDDSARFARDVFLIQSMIKSREDGGRACFIVGKTAISGDPLKPSRLFFRCKDEELPARVQKLLAEPETARPRSFPKVIFPLDPARPEKVQDPRGEKYISVTSLKNYLECPFRYYLAKILGMEESDDGKAGLDAMDFGSIVHEILQDMGMDKELWSMPDPDKLGDVLADLASEKINKRFGHPPSPYVVVSLYAAQERLRAAARVQVELVADGWEIVDVETGQGKSGAERDRWRLKRNGFMVSGIIDRIDQHKDSGKIRIMDYKTFDDFKRTPESSHLETRKDSVPDYNRLDLGDSKKKERRWVDLQLAVYGMIYAQDTAFDASIELGYFLLPKVVSKTGFKLWTEFDDVRMKSAVACLDGVLAGIDNEIFWPPVERVKYDDFESLFRFEESVKKI